MDTASLGEQVAQAEAEREATAKSHLVVVLPTGAFLRGTPRATHVASSVAFHLPSDFREIEWLLDGHSAVLLQNRT
jgi:hypothetical protein